MKTSDYGMKESDIESTRNNFLKDHLDLVKACRRWLDHYDRYVFQTRIGDEPGIAEMRVAIAKATGEEVLDCSEERAGDGVSTTKHTSGEWVIDPMSDSETIAVCNGDGDGKCVCILQIDADYPERLAEANAKRIVDCINGCDGINPEAVKELIAAVNVLVGINRRDDIGGLDRFSDQTWREEAWESVRAALAKATGEEVPA